jgi:hypothetical protein
MIRAFERDDNNEYFIELFVCSLHCGPYFGFY